MKPLANTEAFELKYLMWSWYVWVSACFVLSTTIQVGKYENMSALWIIGLNSKVNNCLFHFFFFSFEVFMFDNQIFEEHVHTFTWYFSMKSTCVCRNTWTDTSKANNSRCGRRKSMQNALKDLICLVWNCYQKEAGLYGRKEVWRAVWVIV